MCASFLTPLVLLGARAVHSHLGVLAHQTQPAIREITHMAGSSLARSRHQQGAALDRELLK
jgi:hypothetical protein